MAPGRPEARRSDPHHLRCAGLPEALRPMSIKSASHLTSTTRQTRHSALCSSRHRYQVARYRSVEGSPTRPLDPFAASILWSPTLRLCEAACSNVGSKSVRSGTRLQLMPGRGFCTRARPGAQGLRQLRPLLGPGWQQPGPTGTRVPHCVRSKLHAPVAR